MVKAEQWSRMRIMIPALPLPASLRAAPPPILDPFSPGRSSLLPQAARAGVGPPCRAGCPPHPLPLAGSV